MTSRIARWWVLGRKDMDSPLVTVVKMSGVLQAGGRGPQARRLLNIDRVERWLQRAFYKPLGPAACAISINSPGGSPVQSELIHDMIQRLRKQTGVPVYTFAEDVAASGGYWLMCAGDEAYACQTSLVGSIGVVSATFGAVNAAERLGIQRRIWTAGHAKVPLDPFLPVTPQQEDRLKDIMTDLHESFKDTVKASRGMRLTGSEEEVFSGRAWTGRQAKQLGLVDGVGSLTGVMREKLGDKTRFLLCSESTQPGLRDLIPGFRLRCAEGWGETLRGGPSSRQSMAEDVAQMAVAAAIDEVEERSIWAAYKLA